VAYTDQWTFGTTFDLTKLGVVPGGTIQVTWTDRNGSNLSDDAGLGTLQQVQEVFGRGQTLRLTQFWYDQKFIDGAVDWKIGRITFGEDFASFSCDFQNLTFCGAQPGNLVGNYIYNWPVSQWATRLKFNLQGLGYFQFGVFDANPNYLSVQQSALPNFENRTEYAESRALERIEPFGEEGRALPFRRPESKTELLLILGSNPNIFAQRTGGCGEAGAESVGQFPLKNKAFFTLLRPKPTI
jgi:hypothetical protein